ncbi:DUF512 domain-containing protein [Halanaerobium hydrogeniformans]|uniref:Radical SAM domain protein n=1 Tax=Halanaerobium hydrogeniformans TaxID=656519 RepID=E4RJ52_HALHG|nr:DUF512 domain-containing protein [Halanaerobium hydrogeniformans]ADQ15272.1 Radical SAM domain protein [Halanaerobium hydrogeniformans]
MLKDKKEILFKTVKENNILPLTSICKLNCIFCSHKNNPPEIETYSFGHLDFELIKIMLEFLDHKKPVIIGESASKIIEGEPFAHPKIMKILKLLRKKRPGVEIKITTSASFIEEKELKQLAKLAPLELNISLNAPGPEERVFLMNDPQPDNVFKIIKELKNYPINFQASIVSMHHMRGFSSLEQTLDFLEKHNPPQTLRIFLAGFSDFARGDNVAGAEYYFQLKQFLDSKAEKYSYPIIIEPQIIDNLNANIEGIIKNSAADLAGLKKSDIIIKVNGEKTQSRVDAFYKIKKSADPELLLKRKKQTITISLIKKGKEKSGIIMAYDISSRKKEKLLAYLEQSLKAKENISTAVLCSKIAFPLLKNITKKFLKGKYNFALLKAENEFFGGNIFAAGLLLNSDLIKIIEKSNFNFKRLILPEIIYDYYGNDLAGNAYTELEDRYDCEVILL